MNDENNNNSNYARSGDLHPRHSSWARLTVKSNITAFAIVLIVIVSIMMFTGLLDSVWSISLAAILVIGAIIMAISAPGHRETPDNRTEQMIVNAWRDDSRVNENLIFVHFSNGVAHLSGRQETTQAKQAAEEIAAGIEGVKRISNGIEVMPSV